jgi:hypothetical protein
MSRSVESLNNCDNPTESFESGLSPCHHMYLVLMHVVSLDHRNATRLAQICSIVLRVSLSRSGPSPPHHFQLYREHIDVLHVYGGLRADHLYSFC